MDGIVGAMCRALLDAALAWADERHDLSKLSTHVPEVFAPRGFRIMPTSRFVARASAGARAGELRRLDLSTEPDRDVLHARFAVRTPVSHVLGTRDTGWLCTIDAALARVTNAWFFDAPTLDALVVATQRDGTWIVHDIIGARLPDLDALIAVLPGPFDRVALTFTPDRIAPHAIAEPTPPADGVLMVRGDWPELGPIGIPALWEH
jgi:hypothetical protein